MRAIAMGVHVLDVLVLPVESIPEGQGGELVEEIRITAAGSAGGTALVLAKLGAEARSAAAVGDDPLGDMLVRLLERDGVDALIPIGGEDTLGVAGRLWQEGVPVVGVPKTIDNDLDGTDYTFGFQTAVQIATDAIDRLHTTAESHHRNLVVEVMGRHAGWIALHSGLAGGADVILIPERPFDIEEVVRLIRRRHSRGRFFSIVVVAEGAVPVEGTLEVIGRDRDEFGHERLGGIGQLLEREIGDRTGFDTRATVLGHIQRGGTPTAFDRVLATRLGLAAIDAANERRWGVMPALIGTRIELVALGEAVAKLRLVPEEEYAAAAAFFG